MQHLARLWRQPLSKHRFHSHSLTHPSPSKFWPITLHSRRLQAVSASDLPPSPMPVPLSDESHKFGNFDLVKRVKLDFSDITVSKWRSRITGLTVVHLDYEAPIVNGYFVVGTEIFDDSGCPHTLEHLVFMGSEKYPYKGIIDHLANRGFSNGTNAWTDTDHTAYTVSTAGEQGFLQILPIYVDHVLYPTITDAGFLTEVHHIDPEGHDSGVVYSEMQGRENTSGDLMALRSQRLLNPVGSAYRSETGGLMENLRILSADQIRNYHRSYYVPHNLSLIVGGKLSNGTESLLKVVQEKVEPSLIEHGQNKGVRPPGWKRPFVETASANRKHPEQTTASTVEFPEKDESMGELIITFLGPPWNQFLDRRALDLLGTYLTSSATAPLNKEYIEIEEPLCSYIYFGEDTRASFVDLAIYIGSVPVKHIDDFEVKLKKSLQKVVEDGIDMERMKMVINRDERQLRSRLESARGDVFSGTIIDDVLYGRTDGSELHDAMDEINGYKILRQWTSKQWTDVLKKYYIDPHSIVVRGKPSAKLADKLERDEKVRLEAQVKALGSEGLAHAAKILAAAKAEHDKPIPTDVLTSFPVPDVKSISFIPVQSVQLAGKGRETKLLAADAVDLAKKIGADGGELPFFVQFDHVQSDFTSVHVLFSLDHLPDRLRPYMSTYLSAFFSLPVKWSSGETLSHEEVVNKLDDETVSYEVGFGISNICTETLRVSLKVETARYEQAVAWLRDLLYGSQFTKERLAVAIAKIQQSLPELKRDGNTVLGSVWSDLLFSEKSTSRLSGVLPQMEFIPKLAEQLRSSPDAVISDFEIIRESLLKPTGVRFAVTGNVQDIPQPRSVFSKYFGDVIGAAELEPLTPSSATLNAVGVNPVKKAVVVSLPTIESAFVQHSTAGLRGWGHPEYPALRVTLEVLNATESYLWRYIRGSGLAYGAYVSNDLESGLLSFTLYRSSNSIEALKQASTVIKGLVDGSIELEQTTLDAAKSSIVYGVAKGVSTPGSAAIVSFINQAIKGVSQNYSAELLERYQEVTKDEVLQMLKEHFLPLFDSSTSVAVVVTAPGKVESVTKDLTQAGFEVENKSLEVDEEMDDEGDESGSESISEDDRRL